MWRDARLVAGKDLRIEARSKVTTSQVAPFAVLILILFAFALKSEIHFPFPCNFRNRPWTNGAASCHSQLESSSQGTERID